MLIFVPQLNFLIYTYQCLVKDREYIASEVLSEYNEKVGAPPIFLVNYLSNAGNSSSTLA